LFPRMRLIRRRQYCRFVLPSATKPSSPMAIDATLSVPRNGLGLLGPLGIVA
jgi:hypothetical protein